MTEKDEEEHMKGAGRTDIRIKMKKRFNGRRSQTSMI